MSSLAKRAQRQYCGYRVWANRSKREIGTAWQQWTRIALVCYIKNENEIINESCTRDRGQKRRRKRTESKEAFSFIQRRTFLFDHLTSLP